MLECRDDSRGECEVGPHRLGGIISLTSARLKLCKPPLPSWVSLPVRAQQPLRHLACLYSECSVKSLAAPAHGGAPFSVLGINC